MPSTAMMIAMKGLLCECCGAHSASCPSIQQCGTGPSAFLVTQQGLDWETESISGVSNTCFDSGSPITLPTGCEGTVNHVTNSCAWSGTGFSLDGGNLDDFDTHTNPGGGITCVEDGGLAYWQFSVTWTFGCIDGQTDPVNVNVTFRYRVPRLALQKYPPTGIWPHHSTTGPAEGVNIISPGEVDVQ